MEETLPPQQPAQETVGVQAPATSSRWMKFVLLGIGIVVVLGIVGAIATVLFTKSPEQVLSSFIKASQARKPVAESAFFDQQAEQNFAIVYKIPPKSAHIRKTTISDKTALVEVDWTMIDSSHQYRERTDTVIFSLRKDGRTWKLDRVKQGDIVNFDFLFGN